MAQPRPFASKESSVCEQCVSIFQEKCLIYTADDQNAWPLPVHHQSLESFEAAVQSGCVLCHRMWNEIHRQGRGELITLERATVFSRYALRKFQDDDRADYWLTLVVLHPSLRPEADGFSVEHGYDGPTQSLEHEPSTMSETTWGQALKWNRECRSHHTVCKSYRDPSYLPTRVLDISGNQNDDIKLAVTQNCMKALGDNKSEHEFATLSHCWGRNPIITLRQDNISQFQHSITMTALPLVFQQAIYVARKLGFAYLWIDSLCIIQDSEEDWRHESALMGKVYSNSSLNIMATDSKDGTQGLFRDRNPLDLQHCVVRAGWTGIAPESFYIYDWMTWDNPIVRAPLNGRGWVLQERILSPRVLHFSHNQLAWECHEKDACEMYPDGIPTIFVNFDTQVKIMDPEAYLKWVNSWRQLHFKPTIDVGYAIWKRLVHLYSQTRVTKASDKLIAISGLANRMRAVMQNDEKYLAGLWSHHLTSQLLWRVAPNALGSRIPRWRRPYRAPSWSWASLETEVYMSMEESSAPRSAYIDIEEASVTPLSLLSDTGEVVDGHIRLRGSLMRAKLVSSSEEGSRKMDLWVNEMKTDSAISLDEVSLEDTYSVVYLPVAGEYNPDSDSQAVIGIRALLLVPVEGKPQGWYSRFGFVDTWHDSEDPEPMNHLIRVMEDRTFSNESLYLERVPRTIMFV
ncbi:unnamed protein product [Clonostachys solani]|uniref:Heterokaryon incompatibility domain-containing protein n=1 Tax=Clonostachys solani TaxID=160281 RepID=A0A9N9W9R1_9HYPO|nr:unnamed protein product [Clonostachys solani]